MSAPLREPARRPRGRLAKVIALHPCEGCGKPSTRISERLSPEKEIVEVAFCTKCHKISNAAWAQRKKILDFLKEMNLHPCVIDAMMEANIEVSLDHGLP